MIDRDHGLSLGRQAKALGISRGSVYALPRPTSDADLALMRRIDDLHLDYPFAGSRMLKGLLKAEGYDVGRRHVSTLMKRMAIAALYRRPNTSKPAPGHKIYPYLLRNPDFLAGEGEEERHQQIVDQIMRRQHPFRMSVRASMKRADRPARPDPRLDEMVVSLRIEVSPEQREPRAEQEKQRILLDAFPDPIQAASAPSLRARKPGDDPE